MAKDRPRNPTASRNPLTDYEAEQVAQIAAWKGETPNIAKRIFRRVTGPIGSLVNKVLPKKAVQAAMDMVNKMAGRLAKDDSILNDPELKKQGIKSLRDIAARPLGFCDGLADRVIRDADNIALGMGAATGAGGPVAAAGLPVLVAGALRVIHRVSQAYGYAVEHPGDKELMLHILALSTAASPDERAQAMANYQRQIEASFLHQAMGESANKALQRVVLGAELGTLIPGFSIAFNAYLNREFVHRAGTAAKRVFQEHWLRERGKVVWIRPSRQAHSHPPGKRGFGPML